MLSWERAIFLTGLTQYTPWEISTSLFSEEHSCNFRPCRGHFKDRVLIQQSQFSAYFLLLVFSFTQKVTLVMKYFHFPVKFYSSPSLILKSWNCSHSSWQSSLMRTSLTPPNRYRCSSSLFLLPHTTPTKTFVRL